MKTYTTHEQATDCVAEISPGVTAPQANRRSPWQLPLGFPLLFADRLKSLSQSTEVSDQAFQHLYFDMVLCPQLHASMRRMHPGFVGASDKTRSEAVFFDPTFNWAEHINERLNHRWRECLMRCGAEKVASEELVMLAGFRLLATHL